MTFTVPNQSQVLFWNIWGHRHPNALHKFLQTHAPATDIFCLTEVTDVEEVAVSIIGTPLKFGDNPKEEPQHVNGYAQLQQELGEMYQPIYGSSRRSDWTCERNGHEFPEVGFGSALFFRHDVNVIATGESLLCEQLGEIRPRLVQWIVYEKAGVRYLAAHFHGVWIRDNTKGDDPARIQQSLQFLELLHDIVGKHAIDKVVFGGDFNLDINTKALALLKDLQHQRTGPFRNLIEEFGIKNTRTTEYRKYNWPGESMYADYAFVGANVAVHDFEVLNDVRASDHAPVLLRFS